MQTTFEQAVEVVNSLSAEDYEKFREWMQENSPNAEQLKPKYPIALDWEKWRERTEKFNRALRWIEEHRAEYLGQWVCLDGDRLISYGKDAQKVYEEAKRAGIEIPFIEHIVEEEPFYIGG